MTPDIFSLTKVIYAQEKKQVIAEFSSEEKKISQRFQFFPSTVFSLKNTSWELVEQILGLYDGKRFRRERIGESAFRLTASTFSDLKKLSNLLSSTLSLNSNLLEPERQFLVEINWSYFDCFEQGRPGFEKASSISLPNIRSEFFCDSLQKTVSDIRKQDSKAAKNFLKQIALSNLLRIPLDFVPDTRLQQLDIFLENLFFGNSFPLQKCSCEKILKKPFTPIPFQQELSKIDFSNVFPTLLTFSFYNLGFESINCSCCKPASLEEKNLLPSTLVRAKFLQDSFFFESKNPEFAQSFHSSMPGKDSRLQMRREWFLNYFPAGPFSRNQVHEIPLNDALSLSRQKRIELLGFGSCINWFCRKKESFLSKKIVELNKKELLLEQQLSSLEESALAKSGLTAMLLQQSSIQHLFLSSFKESIQELLSGIPLHLSNPASAYYHAALSSAVDCVRTAVLADFKEFSSKQGLKCFNAGSKAFVPEAGSFALAKAFSRQSLLPMPYASLQS